MILGSLGDITFEASSRLVRTYGSYTETIAARTETHNIGGTDPIVEYIGPDVRALSIPVSLHAYLGVDVEDDIKTLQRYARVGEMLTLIIGRQPVGGAGAQWILESVDASRTEFDGNGNAISAEITLSLKLARTAEAAKRLTSSIEKSNTARKRIG